MKLHIAYLAAFAMHFEVRHALSHVLEIPDFELAKFFAAATSDGTILSTLLFHGLRIEQLARLGDRRSPASCLLWREKKEVQSGMDHEDVGADE